MAAAHGARLLDLLQLRASKLQFKGVAPLFAHGVRESGSFDVPEDIGGLISRQADL